MGGFPKSVHLPICPSDHPNYISALPFAVEQEIPRKDEAVVVVLGMPPLE